MFEFLKKKKEVEVKESPVMLDGDNVNQDTVIAVCNRCKKEFKVLEHYYCTEKECKIYLNCFVSTKTIT